MLKKILYLRLFVLQWTQQCRAHTLFLIWASHRRRHPQWNESHQNIRLCSMESSASTPTWLTARPRIPPPQQVMRFTHSFIHHCLYRPMLGLGLFFSFVSFFFFLHTVGLLWRVISPSQGRYLHTGQHKHRINAHTYPCLEWDSNSQSQLSSERRQFLPQNARPLRSASTYIQLVWLSVVAALGQTTLWSEIHLSVF
jgi:hypothetical protein